MTLAPPRYTLEERRILGRRDRIWAIWATNVRMWAVRAGPLILTALGFLVTFIPLLLAIVIAYALGFTTTVQLDSFGLIVFDVAGTVLFLFILLMTTLVGSGVISDDLRTRAIALYLSRPISALDYLVGKAGILGFFLALLCIVPGILVGIIGSTLGLYSATVGLEVVGGFLGVGSITCFVFTGLGLLLSSISNRRAVAAAGIFAFLLLNTILIDIVAAASGNNAWYYASPWVDVQTLGGWAFGLGIDPSAITPLYAPNALAVLLGVGTACFLLLWLRLLRLEVVAD